MYSVERAHELSGFDRRNSRHKLTVAILQEVNTPKTGYLILECLLITWRRYGDLYRGMSIVRIPMHFMRMDHKLDRRKGEIFAKGISCSRQPF